MESKRQHSVILTAKFDKKMVRAEKKIRGLKCHYQIID